MKGEFTYQGEELDLFRHAINWKKYVAKEIKPYIIGDVAEVGAGPGNFSPFLMRDDLRSWTFIEPDGRYSQSLSELGVKGLTTTIVKATLAQLPGAKTFDSIIYLDVLEHIANDRQEVKEITKHLNPGGFAIVLCPAFNFLFSPFDAAIGHHRRYKKHDLLRLMPPEMTLIACYYLDSAGFLASAMNKTLLKQSYPTIRQIKFWDRMLVPLSRFSDSFFSNYFGRSVLLIAQLNKQVE